MEDVCIKDLGLKEIKMKLYSITLRYELIHIVFKNDLILDGRKTRSKIIERLKPQRHIMMWDGRLTAILFPAKT